MEQTRIRSMSVAFDRRVCVCKNGWSKRCQKVFERLTRRKLEGSELRA